jgi:hypothetical protein
MMFSPAEENKMLSDMNVRREKACKETFEKWKNGAVTKATLESFEGDNPEDEALFNALLQDAFDNGFSAGGACAMIDVLDGLFKPTKPTQSGFAR